MDISTLLLILIPIIVAILSSYLTYFFTIKFKKTESMLKFKEEKYSNLLVLLQGFVGASVSGEKKRKFFEEQYKSWLYCSDGVLKAINNMVQVLIENKGNAPEASVSQKIIGNIVLEMRKDLLGKTKLTYEDFRYTDVLS